MTIKPKILGYTPRVFHTSTLGEYLAMGPEVIVAIAAGILSLLSGKLFVNEVAESLLKKLVLRLGWFKKKREPSYSEKLAGLTSNLMKASNEMDGVLTELAEVAKDREQAMQKVETDLLNLQNREKELQKRIDQLQNVPLPVAQEFARLTSSGEKRSARRDYILFGAGVVVSTAIAIILRVFGLG